MIVTVSKKAKIAMKLKLKVAMMMMMMMMMIRSCYCVGRVSGYPRGGWRGVLVGEVSRQPVSWLGREMVSE